MTQNSGTSRTTNGSVPKVKVLVADDERTIANTLVAILNKAGFEAMAVYDGRAAVNAIISFRPDVLLSDVIMPEMSGIEAAVAILAICPDCRVVLFSGHGGTADLLQDAHAQGHRFEVMAKPFHPAAMLEMLGAGHSLLSGSSEAQSSSLN